MCVNLLCATVCDRPFVRFDKFRQRGKGSDLVAINKFQKDRINQVLPRKGTSSLHDDRQAHIFVFNTVNNPIPSLQRRFGNYLVLVIRKLGQFRESRLPHPLHRFNDPQKDLLLFRVNKPSSDHKSLARITDVKSLSHQLGFLHLQRQFRRLRINSRSDLPFDRILYWLTRIRDRRRTLATSQKDDCERDADAPYNVRKDVCHEGRLLHGNR